MRGLTIVTTLALAVSLFGTAQAMHTTAPDADDVAVQIADLDATTAAFDRLVLPDVVQMSTDSGMQASLPGADEPLRLDGALARASADVLHADIDVTTPDLDLAPAADAPSPSEDATTRDAADAEISLDAADATEAASDETASGHEDTSKTSSEEDAQASTQADASSTASTVKDAWDERSAAEKAAIGAGLLGALLLGPLTMYSRIQRDDALENDTRRAIYQIVETSPGVCIQDVADDADVSYSTASYHLDKLVRMDYLARRKDGNKVLYYKNGGTFTQDEQQLLPVLKNTEAMRVFQQILENPWCYRAEVAEALDVSHTTVNWHLDNLQEADLVEEHREGRSCHLRIPEDAMDRVSDVVEKLDELGVEDDVAPLARPAVA